MSLSQISSLTDLNTINQMLEKIDEEEMQVDRDLDYFLSNREPFKSYLSNLSDLRLYIYYKYIIIKMIKL